MYFHYRSNKELAEDTTSSTKYTMYKIEPTDSEWKSLNNLHSEMLKKYGIVDLSATSHEINFDPTEPVYIIKPWPSKSRTILAAFQGLP